MNLYFLSFNDISNIHDIVLLLFLGDIVPDIHANNFSLIFDQFLPEGFLRVHNLAKVNQSDIEVR